MVVKINLGLKLQIHHLSWRSSPSCYCNLSIKSISKFCEIWISNFYRELLKTVPLKKPESYAEQLENIKLNKNGFSWVAFFERKIVYFKITITKKSSQHLINLYTWIPYKRKFWLLYFKKFSPVNDLYISSTNHFKITLYTIKQSNNREVF